VEGHCCGEKSEGGDGREGGSMREVASSSKDDALCTQVQEDQEEHSGAPGVGEDGAGEEALRRVEEMRGLVPGKSESHGRGAQEQKRASPNEVGGNQGAELGEDDAVKEAVLEVAPGCGDCSKVWKRSSGEKEGGKEATGSPVHPGLVERTPCRLAPKKAFPSSQNRHCASSKSCEGTSATISIPCSKKRGVHCTETETPGCPGKAGTEPVLEITKRSYCSAG